MRHTAQKEYPGLPPSSPDAAAYGDLVVALGRKSALDPVAELAYGADPNQRLHVYVPDGLVGKKLPVVIFFHGGAWVSGGLSWLRFMAPMITTMPAIFVASTYRLAPQSQWPTQYDDVCAAISYVSAHAVDFGGDPTRIIVGGHSAGGHLASLAVLKREIRPVRACFPLSCSFDLQYGDVAIDSPEGRVYKYLFTQRDQDCGASPINFAKGNPTPFHIVWGERDFARIMRSSERMVGVLRGEGSQVTSTILAGAGHFDTHLQLADPNSPWYARLQEEFERAE